MDGPLSHVADLAHLNRIRAHSRDRELVVHFDDGPATMLARDLDLDAVVDQHGCIYLGGPAVSPAPVIRDRSKGTPTMPTVDVDELLARLTATNPTIPPSTWRVLERAAQHVVIDPATSAQTAGGFATSDAAWNARIEDLFANRLALLGALPFVVEHAGTGMPPVPVFDVPTAAAQGGEKKELPSEAFTIGAAASPAVIDSTLYLNVSQQLERDMPGVVAAVLTYAVAAVAEQQAAAGIVAAGTTAATLDAGLAAFTGPLWRPDLLLVAPADAAAILEHTTGLAALGIRVLFVPTLASSVLLDAAAVTGWFAPLAAEANEPAVFGRQIARAIFGKLGATAAGVQVLTAIA